MRLKYKKLIVIFSLAIMLIGLGTFSLIAPSVDFSFGGGSAANSATGSAIASFCRMMRSNPILPH